MFDFFSFDSKKGSYGLSNADDLFINLMKQDAIIWNQVITTSNVLCCPLSCSLSGEISRKQLLAHVLVPANDSGDYTTLGGEKVFMKGSELFCGSGFTEPRRVKVLSCSEMIDDGKSATIYYLSRPLVGGIAAPDDADEITHQFMLKCVAVLRSFPVAEIVFVALDDYIQEVNFVGLHSSDGFNRVSPSLAQSIHAQWQRATDRLIQSETLSFALDSSISIARNQIGQIIESYLMQGVYNTVYPWLQLTHSPKNEDITNVISLLKTITMSDIGLPVEFQCSLHDAVGILRTIGTVHTPLDKLLVLKTTVSVIRECADNNATLNFPGLDMELSTDDIVMFLIWVIIQCTITGYRDLATDLQYVRDYHFVSSSKRQLGFTTCHFQVAMSWIKERIDSVGT